MLELAKVTSYQGLYLQSHSSMQVLGLYMTAECMPADVARILCRPAMLSAGTHTYSSREHTPHDTAHASQHVQQHTSQQLTEGITET